MSMLVPVLGNTNAGPTLIQAITAAGLTSNLQLCLDAGDSASYTSGTKWLDQSGNGYDFFLGSDGGGTDDPTFTGTAGTRTSYWTGDGSKYFTYDTTNETWMQNIHKNNANFTLFAVVRGTTAGVSGTLASDGTGTGFKWTWARTGTQILTVQNAGVGVLSATKASADVGGQWSLVAVSLNEATGAGGGFFYHDGSASSTFDSTYSSPAAGNATSTMNVGASGGGAGGFLTGLACFAAWSTALTSANLDALYAQIRARFGR